MQRRWKPTKRYWKAYNALYGEDATQPLGQPLTPKEKTPPRLPNEAEPPIPSEKWEQMKLVGWLRQNQIVCHHSPNGGRRSMAEGVAFKAQGTSAGFPDLTIPYARKGYHGLYLELKRIKGGVLSPEQKWWRDFLQREGYCWFEAKGHEAGIKFVQDYFS